MYECAIVLPGQWQLCVILAGVMCLVLCDLQVVGIGCTVCGRSALSGSYIM